jgi:hypothetical protein
MTVLGWENCLDLAGTILALTLMVLLLLNRLKYGRMVLGADSSRNARSDFCRELHARTHAARSLQALENVAAAVEAEHRRLQEWAEQLEASESFFPEISRGTVDGSWVASERVFTDSGKGGAINGCYAEALRLTASGMSVVEAARTVKRPVGEVELFLDLERRRCGGRLPTAAKSA